MYLLYMFSQLSFIECIMLSIVKKNIKIFSMLANTEENMYVLNSETFETFDYLKLICLIMT